MEFKAIVSDVDKTLTNDRMLVDLHAIQTIRELDDAGIPVVLVTARDTMTAGSLAMFFGACGLVAAENGSVMWNIRNDFEPLVLGDMERVKSGLEALGRAYGDVLKVVPTPGRLASAVVRRTFDVDQGNALLADHKTHTRLLDSSLAYHLVDEDTGKGRGVRETAKLLDILPENIVAIGDNFNDVEMFEAAGYSIAVGNAPQAVKNQVDYACTAFYGEGFCEGVKHALEVFNVRLVAGRA